MYICKAYIILNKKSESATIVERVLGRMKRQKVEVEIKKVI
jgi:hypothetical protein